MNSNSLNNLCLNTCFCFPAQSPTPKSHLRQQSFPTLSLVSPLVSKTTTRRECTPPVRQNVTLSSSWDDKPFQVYPNGSVVYLDEMDVVTFLDPPKDLIPLDPSSYNPASYLWKKIEDIPEDRRHRLLKLLKPGLVSRAWEIAGTRYDDPKFAVKSASNLFSDGKDGKPLEFWNCRTSGGPPPIAWMNSFKKALFYSEDRKLYGRFIGGSFLKEISSSFAPLYFTVNKEWKEVMVTEQPCDLAYEFGEGPLNISAYPDGFPKPAVHPWPFNDQVVVYVRHVGPGVLVGQAWQEGAELEQLPKKLCGEILMVKDFSVTGSMGTSSSTER